LILITYAVNIVNRNGKRIKEFILNTVYGCAKKKGNTGIPWRGTAARRWLMAREWLRVTFE